MSPEEFDQAYYDLSQALGKTSDPTLLRDRLILLLVQECSTEAASRIIRYATDVPDDAVLREADSSGARAHQLAHAVPAL